MRGSWIHVSPVAAALVLPPWIPHPMADPPARAAVHTSEQASSAARELPETTGALTEPAAPIAADRAAPSAGPTAADRTADRALVDRVLARDPAATRTFVDRLVPVIQSRVARALLRRRGAAQGRDVRQEVEDQTQSVLLALFEADGRVLRAWDPERGLSLKNFVGLVAERHVAGTLRSARRSPWTEDPTLGTELDEVEDSRPTPERLATDRELASAVLDRMRARLSPLGLKLFEALMVEARPTEEVCSETGMARAALYTWRSRLTKLVKSIALELEGDGETP